MSNKKRSETNRSPKTGPAWYWLGYCGLLLAVGYGQMLRKLLTDTGGFSSRYLAAMISTLLVVALIAKARGTALWKPWPWQLLAGLLALICLLGLLFGVYLAANGTVIAAASLLASAVLLIPAAQQLYSYGFRSSELWEAESGN